jgi:tetratricopeptide (TPR) repeat protein
VTRARHVVVALALAACGHPTASKTPTDVVRNDILRAEDAEKARRHDEARKYYELAVTDATASKDKTSVHIAHREYGETLATWGEIEAAKVQLDASIAAIDSDPIAWQMLGIVRNKLGDVAGAFAALEKSKALAPKAWIPRRDLAVLHWSQGHREQALAEYKAMLELDLPERLRDKVEWAISALSKPEPFKVPDKTQPREPQPLPEPAPMPAPSAPPPAAPPAANGSGS